MEKEINRKKDFTPADSLPKLTAMAGAESI